MTRRRLCRAALALTLAGVCAGLAAQPAGMPASPPNPAPRAQPLGCLIEPHRVADVGSPVIGVIEQLHAERGDRVTAGQPLATLRAQYKHKRNFVAGLPI